MTEKTSSKYEDLASMLSKDPGFFKTLIDALPIQIFIKDTKSRFLAANAATAYIMGAPSADSLIGKTDADFYPSDMADQYVRDEQQLMTTGDPVVGKEEPKTDKVTGIKRLIWVTKLPIRDHAGRVIGLVGFGNDMTERKHAEEKLREERNSLRTLIDTLPDYIYLKDTQSRFLISNIAHAKHMGAGAPEELIGKTDFDFYPKHLAEQFFADEQNIIKTGKPLLQKDETNTTLNGHTARVLSTKLPLRDSSGRIVGIVGTSLEITEKKKMEEELREVNAKLLATLDELKRTQEQVIQSERLRALGQMASGIAHDFNNALTPILGYTDLLLGESGVLDKRDVTLNMLTDIRTAAVDAAQTVRRLSEFYAPAKKTARKPVDLQNLIDSTLALTRPLWKEEMAAKGINIQVGTELGDVRYVSGNESQLREMLTNVIFNAVDAMPKGGTITIRARPEPPFIAIEIIDTGTGMTEEVRRRCFEPFFTTKHKRGGGLGLAMVHGIVRQHEGNIEIQSVEGKGTTVIVRIPESSAPVKHTQTQIIRPVEVKQMRVLLIDDEEIVRQTIEACLKGDNHTVRTATDGNEGINLFRIEKFDAVITDRAMPGMSGDQLAAELKKISPDIPVIMLTGFGHMMKDTHQHPACVDLIVSKPVTRDALRDALAKVTSRRKR
jgi:PAS domain S-box-containing protein